MALSVNSSTHWERNNTDLIQTLPENRKRKNPSQFILWGQSTLDTKTWQYYKKGKWEKRKKGREGRREENIRPISLMKIVEKKIVVKNSKILCKKNIIIKLCLLQECKVGLRTEGQSSILPHNIKREEKSYYYSWPLNNNGVRGTNSLAQLKICV